ncbi:MAG: hypothetical protein CUN56_11200 [Phototrophicales bacterium]|nr:MAG: hypothetical protein CUN56_11200 [Phototrophicales bacterium]RMG75126.1 MAG: response regulator [Chloroflexota bacterium]
MRLVRKIVTNAGHTLLEAVDGNSGLELAQQELPDIILMDVNLPDIDGLEVTARLKEDAKTAHIPVIALTANAMVGDKEKALDAGCDDYLPKPVSRQILLETLNKYDQK